MIYVENNGFNIVQVCRTGLCPKILPHVNENRGKKILEFLIIFLSKVLLGLRCHKIILPKAIKITEEDKHKRVRFNLYMFVLI